MSDGPEGFAFPPLREPGTLGKPTLRVKPASGPAIDFARGLDVRLE